jgi:hypothetical protein
MRIGKKQWYGFPVQVITAVCDLAITHRYTAEIMKRMSYLSTGG